MTMPTRFAPLSEQDMTPEQKRVAHPVGEFGTAQQRMEGAAQPGARPARDRMRDALLLGGHILLGQRRETRWHCHSSMARGL